MSLSPRTPVLVGVGAVQQRESDPALALEPFELMLRALERAAEDAGCPKLLALADSVRAPRGFWSYPDPCRLIADRLEASGARTEVAEVGVLQTTLLGRAARDIAEKRADVVLVTGGEARHRAQRARAAGIEEELVAQPPGTEPDSVVRPDSDIISALEIQSHLAMPVGQYAMLENALRYAEGQSLAQHRRDVAALWSRMSEVAATNPDAWTQERVGPDAIRDPALSEGRNRMLAFPYTKLHNSQWNVDQAAGLIFCSLERAQSLGIPRDRWVFPLAISESNYMLPLTQRRALHRCPGFELAGRQALERAGCEIGEVAHLELYSCFPVAVRVQLRELGIAEDRSHTVTGGMAFGGGPLNNFVLQAQAKMAERLRAESGSLGLVSAVSGVLTKQGVGLWSTEPRGDGFAFGDVSAATQAHIEPVEVVADVRGAARIASYTVLYEGAEIARAVLLCDLPDGRRTIAVCQDRDPAERMTIEEFCGRELNLSSSGRLTLP